MYLNKYGHTRTILLATFLVGAYAKKTTRNFPYVLEANLPSAIFVPGDRDAAKRLK